MNRRRFVQAGATSLLMPATVIVARTPASGDRLAWDRFFFDERFAEARRLARQSSGRTMATAVQGDVTPVWAAGLARTSLATPLRLKGVTTESFYFCLTVLLRERCPVDAQSVRHDRDLHLWTIRTAKHSDHGTTSWQNRFRRV
jgi:hypothetical protein